MAAYLWQRIAREITTAIDSGEFKPGDRLPALLKLAERWEVSAAVVNSACAHLTASGVLRHAPHGPYHVRDPGQASEPATSGQAPLFLTVAEVATQARLSKMTIYRLIDKGTIRSKRIGRNFRIYADSWHAYLNDC
jgi:excisionase family DNA binding protein